MIEIKNLSKSYGDKKVYENFNLSVENDKILAVLGESGSGKTTLLNILLGLTDFEGEIAGLNENFSAVFQKDRLIPNLTVSQNLKLVNPDMDVESALKSVGLEGQENSFIKNLSAGMSRRVAIIRALKFPSEFLFMDEPFINLDLALKFSLIELVKKEQKSNPRTVIAVTHDIKVAVSIADRIIVLDKGKIIYDNSDINEKVEKELFDLMISMGSLANI